MNKSQSTVLIRIKLSIIVGMVYFVVRVRLHIKNYANFHFSNGLFEILESNQLEKVLNLCTFS